MSGVKVEWAGYTETPASINVQMEPRFMLDFIAKGKNKWYLEMR